MQFIVFRVLMEDDLKIDDVNVQAFSCVSHFQHRLQNSDAERNLADSKEQNLEE